MIAKTPSFARDACHVTAVSALCVIVHYVGQGDVALPTIVVLGIVLAVFARTLEGRGGAYVSHVAGMLAVSVVLVTLVLGAMGAAHYALLVAGALVTNIAAAAVLGGVLNRWVRTAPGERRMGLLPKLTGGLVALFLGTVWIDAMAEKRASDETRDRMSLMRRLTENIERYEPADSTDTRELLRQEAPPSYDVREGAVYHGYGGPIDFRREGEQLVLAYSEFPSGRPCAMMIWKNRSGRFSSRITLRPEGEPGVVYREGKGTSLKAVCESLSSPVTIEHTADIAHLRRHSRR